MLIIMYVDPKIIFKFLHYFYLSDFKMLKF